MRERERHNQRERETPAEPVTPGAAGQTLNDNRSAAERFLAAGDKAINRALSANSEEFLTANCQEGGQ